jgi:hypothetical protein
VAQLELTLDGVCLACLSFVSFAVDGGDERRVTSEVRRMTPDLWCDGLDRQAFAAVRAARDRGVPDAEEALADLERQGFRSGVARAIVRRLGHELAGQARLERRMFEAARERLRRAPPELN